jgi:hypothetical protein
MRTVFIGTDMNQKYRTDGTSITPISGAQIQLNPVKRPNSYLVHGQS